MVTVKQSSTLITCICFMKITYGHSKTVEYTDYLYMFYEDHLRLQ